MGDLKPDSTIQQAVWNGRLFNKQNPISDNLDEGSFTRIFIISPTYESNPIFHVLHADEKDVYTSLRRSIPDVEEYFRKMYKRQ